MMTPENMSPQEIQAEIERIGKQIANGNMSELPQLSALIQALEAKPESVSSHQEGNQNTSVQGRGHKVAAPGGMLVEGDLVIGGDRKREAEKNAMRIAYLKQVFRSSNHLYLAGIDPKAADDDGQMQLCAVYTPLLTQAAEEVEGDGNKARTLERGEGHGLMKASRKRSALEALNREKYLVLLGDPGSGKSSFVNFVATCLAGEQLREEPFNLKLLTEPLSPDYLEVPDAPGLYEKEPQLIPQSWEPGPLLPVVMILRDFAASSHIPQDGQAATAKHFWDFITEQLTQHKLERFADTLYAELQTKGGMLLLDGLDEVPTADSHRVHIREMVEDLCTVFSNCRILVTSRTYAYQKQAWQLPSFESTVLTRFNQPQIGRFVESWYAHVGGLRKMTEIESAGRATQLKEAIFNSRRLFNLAESPLLLTLTASLHAWRRGSLPEKREELYADAVDLMLNQWERQRIRQDADGNEVIAQPSLEQWLRLDRDQVRGLLDRLAFEAHARQTGLEGTADIPESDLVLGLVELSRQAIDINEVKAYLRDRAGLLQSRGVGVYTFPHRTFQEYLAACYLTEDEFPSKVAELARKDPNKWREVALLAGAKAAGGSSYALWGLVDELCAGAEEDVQALWGGQLAGQFTVETADLSRLTAAQIEKVVKVKDRLVNVLSGQTLPHTERYQAGINLAKLGDPRLGVMDIDHAEFCLVPKGPFWMGAGEHDTEADDDEKPQHQLNIPYDYWLARFPVTQAQYEQFMADGGYANAAWWPEAIAAKRWEKEAYVDFDGGKRTQPRYGSLPNQPVRGVTWYEAIAYCHWLSDRWRKRGWLAEGSEVTLPSEPEWEKAARGGIEILSSSLVSAPGTLERLGAEVELINNPDPMRVYPWLQFEKLVEMTNHDESGLGGPSTVGSYSAAGSVYGCEELIGNVYEWTRSRWGGYPYEDSEVRERLSRSDRVGTSLRGFPFGSNARWQRCVARDNGFPNFRYYYLGFRIVVSPSLPLDSVSSGR